MQAPIATNRLTRILLVEDDETIREHLGETLRGYAGYDVASAADLASAKGALESTTPDLVILDIGLPDGSGLELIAELRITRPALPILIISVLQDRETVVQALRAGASGYIVKDSLPEDIFSTVESTLRGEVVLTPRIASYLLQTLRAQGAPEPAQQEQAQHAIALTPRELDVLWGIAKGLTYVEIAKTLGVSSQTVPSYVKGIYRKLDVRNRSEAIFEAHRQNLIKF